MTAKARDGDLYTVTEQNEPPLCPCGKGYVGHADDHCPECGHSIDFDHDLRGDVSCTRCELAADLGQHAPCCKVPDFGFLRIEHDDLATGAHWHVEDTSGTVPRLTFAGPQAKLLAHVAARLIDQASYHGTAAMRDAHGILLLLTRAATQRTYCSYCRAWHTATATPDTAPVRRDQDTGTL